MGLDGGSPSISASGYSSRNPQISPSVPPGPCHVNAGRGGETLLAYESLVAGSRRDCLGLLHLPVQLGKLRPYKGELGASWCIVGWGGVTAKRPLRVLGLKVILNYTENPRLARAIRDPVKN